MQGRLEALRSALAALPASDAGYQRRHPYLRQSGPNEFEILGVDYDRRIDDLFATFRDGAFGFAERDREYLSGIKELESTLDGPLCPGDVARLDRETCLLLVRYFDRQERFCDGLRAGVHKDGLLHSVLERLIELEGGAAS